MYGVITTLSALIKARSKLCNHQVRTLSEACQGQVKEVDCRKWNKDSSPSPSISLGPSVLSTASMVFASASETFLSWTARWEVRTCSLEGMWSWGKEAESGASSLCERQSKYGSCFLRSLQPEPWHVLHSSQPQLYLPSETWSSVWDEYRGRDLFLGHPCLNLLDNGIFLHPSHLYIGMKSC